MRKIITVLIFLAYVIPVFSQVSIGSEITAEGNSKIKVKLDCARFRVTIEKQNLIEKTAIKELNEEIEKLQKGLFNIGFTEKNIKISEYRISSSENNDNKKEYTVTNSLSINFALDNKIIEAFYQEIQSENIKDLDVEFETFLSEELEKTLRLKLVQNAINDAKNNADNIAKALDVKIVNVKQVSKYALRDMVAYDRVNEVKAGRIMAAAASSPKTSFDKFEVEEKELEETINIIYGIAKNKK